MDFKKRVSGSWTDTPNYIMGTSTDTITTLPTDIYPTDTTVTVGLKGNIVQNGTPTPDNPVMPQETGERTRNMFDKYGDYYAGSNTNNYTITGLKPNTQYTCSTNFTKTSNTASIYFGGGSSAYNGVWANIPNRQTSTAEGTLSLLLRYHDEAGAPAVYDDVMNGNIWVMVNEGTTPLPYEPYGYKIPISSAGQTTTVYLGEVETTRKIKKLVLTGNEDWIQTVSSLKVYRINISGYLREMVNIPISTHYKGIAPVIGAEGLKDLETAFLLSSSGNNYYYIRDDRFNNANNFKAYLQQQYAAGTPVIIWYVLAEPTTGIVNEPLRKIGDYADTVSGITIPTITGANTIDVDTTLKPSEVSVNYKGWHSIQSLHRFNGGSWD